MFKKEVDRFFLARCIGHCHTSLGSLFFLQHFPETSFCLNFVIPVCLISPLDLWNLSFSPLFEKF